MTSRSRLATGFALSDTFTVGDVWKRERVLQAAPDAASAKAGEGLASTRKWVSIGHDEIAAWGECQGSGARPYQVQVDLREAAFKCSCPSRKFPCKHGIGLMLLFAAAEVPAAQQPAWVAEWLASRAEREAKKAEKAVELSPQKQAGRAEAQEGRRGKRLDKMLQGMEDLRLWLEDLVRSGLASAQTKGFAFFEERARRLVDAQAPGAARLVREIGSAAASGNGWQQRTLEAASLAYLLTEAAGRTAMLPRELREDILATLGLPTAKETIDSAPTVPDIWQVLGRDMEIEANLKTQRTYLFGLQTQRPALLLDFAYGKEALNVAVPIGTLFPADLAFYPGHSLRAGVRNSTLDVAPLTQLRGPDSIAAMLDLHATLVGNYPWLAPPAVPLLNVTLTVQDGAWWLIDVRGDAIPLAMSGRAGWTALAISAGKPASFGVTTDGRSCRLLSIVAGGLFTDLFPPIEAVAS